MYADGAGCNYHTFVEELASSDQDLNQFCVTMDKTSFFSLQQINGSCKEHANTVQENTEHRAALRRDLCPFPRCVRVCVCVCERERERERVAPDFGAVLELRLGGGNLVAQLLLTRADSGHFLVGGG